jgi:hypothetical protein
MSEAEQTDEAGKKSEDEEILKEARDRYQACTTAESDNRNDAKDDLLFLSGGTNQWDPIDAQIRTVQKRPMITVNNLPTFLHQVTNEHRQNKLGGRVHPVDDNTDEETAEVVQGMIRHIEYDSNAAVATNTAVNSAAAIGFGWFRLVTEYESPESFDQKIMFKRIRNALSVHIDPLAQEVDGSDMKYCFIDSLEDREEFKKRYPDAGANNTDLIGQEMYRGWFAENTVLVCEYYRIKTTEATLCELLDGTVGWKDELPPAMVPLIKRERKSQVRGRVVQADRRRCAGAHRHQVRVDSGVPGLRRRDRYRRQGDALRHHQELERLVQDVQRLHHHGHRGSGDAGEKPLHHGRGPGRGPRGAVGEHQPHSLCVGQVQADDR